jgi:hypothetical protein
LNDFNLLLNGSEMRINYTCGVYEVLLSLYEYVSALNTRAKRGNYMLVGSWLFVEY